VSRFLLRRVGVLTLDSGDHSRHSGHKARKAKYEAKQSARLQAERQPEPSGGQAESYENTGTAESPYSTGSEEPGQTAAGKPHIVDRILDSSRVQSLAQNHPSTIGRLVNHEGFRSAARSAVDRVQGAQGTQYR